MRGFALTVVALVAVGAASAGEYSSVGFVELERFSDADENALTLGYRYYFMAPVVDDENPYMLQPFFQKASFAQASYQDGPGDNRTLFAAEARYYLPDMPLGVGGGFGFGDVSASTDISYLALGAEYYIQDDLRAELVFMFGDLDSTDFTGFDFGARYVMPIEEAGGVLELYAGYTSFDTDFPGDEKDDGIVIEGNYFFNKEVYAGIEIVTDKSDTFKVTGGYADETGFQVEGWIGGEDDDTVLGVRAGLRF